jgi:hypothetical protein
VTNTPAPAVANATTGSMNRCLMGSPLSRHNPVCVRLRDVYSTLPDDKVFAR